MLRRPQGKILVFDGSYHGLDLGVLPLASRKDFKDPFDNWIDQDLVVSLPYGCSEDLVKETLSQGEFAAVFVEPIQGRAGIRFAGLEWLQMLRRQSRDANALLVFDEIFTGLGRIGRVTCSDEVEADLICLGKALGGGLPLSACCGTEEAFSHWPISKGEAIHTGTFFGHPLSCRMGRGFLNSFKKEKLDQLALRKGKEFLEILQREIGDHPLVEDIRGYGLMIGVEFRQLGLGATLMDRLRERQVIALASGSQGESISFTPALNISESLLLEAVRRMKSALDDL